MSICLHDKQFDIWIPAEKIQHRIAELGTEITCDYKDKKLLLLCILKGAVPFMADLARAIDLPAEFSFFRVNSYAGTKSSGVINAEFSPSHEWENKDVLIIEDIIDTGLTMNYLMDLVKSNGATSVKSTALLFKPKAFKGLYPPDYCGFSIENQFVVGYGMDYNGLGRNLKDIYKLSES